MTQCQRQSHHSELYVDKQHPDRHINTYVINRRRNGHTCRLSLRLNESFDRLICTDHRQASIYYNAVVGSVIMTDHSLSSQFLHLYRNKPAFQFSAESRQQCPALVAQWHKSLHCCVHDLSDYEASSGPGFDSGFWRLVEHAGQLSAYSYA